RGSPLPAPLPADSVSALLRVGNESTEVTLPANPGARGCNDHFAANVSYLRSAPLFQAAVSVDIDGRRQTADFEPWINTPRGGTPNPRSLAYACPMHPELGAHLPGVRVSCGMPLQPKRPPRPPGELHDSDYRTDMSIVTAASSP